MPYTTTAPLLVDQRAAAQMLGLSERFLEARRHRGGGPPYVRISSRCVRYDVAALREWAREREYRSTSEEAAEVDGSGPDAA